MNIFGFRPFKGKFNLGNSDDIPENQDGTLIGSIKQINASLIGNTIGTVESITMSNYASQSDLLTIPYDCYLNIHSRSVNNERIQCNDENGNELIIARGDGTYGMGATIFLRKGMKVFFASENFTGPTGKLIRIN